jgi:hypothetical protein
LPFQGAEAFAFSDVEVQSFFLISEMTDKQSHNFQQLCFCHPSEEDFKPAERLLTMAGLESQWLLLPL